MHQFDLICALFGHSFMTQYSAVHVKCLLRISSEKNILAQMNIEKRAPTLTQEMFVMYNFLTY